MYIAGSRIGDGRIPGVFLIPATVVKSKEQSLYPKYRNLIFVKETTVLRVRFGCFRFGFNRLLFLFVG